MKDAQHWAKQAIFAQDASNLSGVVHSFSELMSDIHSYSWDRKLGTDWCNHHPLVVLFTDKLADLCGIQRELGTAQFSWAYDWAKEHSEHGGDFEYIVMPTCSECGVTGDHVACCSTWEH